MPPYAESAELIDSIPGAALLWAPLEAGELPVTVVTSPRHSGVDRTYSRIVETSCRFDTGRIAFQELAGRQLDRLLLPAGHRDYRLRFHVADSRCLLQIWNRPRSTSRSGAATASPPRTARC